MRNVRAKAVTVVALAALGAPGLGAQEWTLTERDCDRWGGGDEGRARVCDVRETTVPALGWLEIEGGPNGSVDVVGEDRDDVRVVARTWAHASDDEEARDLLRDVRVVVDGGHIEADGPNWRGRAGWGVSYEIRVPHRTDAWIETNNGGIQLSDLTGDLEFETTNGGVVLAGLAGEVHGHTTNGGVEVRLEGREWDGEGLDVSTTNGGVEIVVPEGYSARLEAGTTNGTIDLDFPVTVQGRVGRRLDTVLGDGGPTIRVTTTNGGVRLVRR